MWPYTSAVLGKLMATSIAAPTTRSASRAVGATPNVAVPRQIRDTFTPVAPRTEYFISVEGIAVAAHSGKLGHQFEVGLLVVASEVIRVGGRRIKDKEPVHEPNLARPGRGRAPGAMSTSC